MFPLKGLHRILKGYIVPGHLHGEKNYDGNYSRGQKNFSAKVRMFRKLCFVDVFQIRDLCITSVVCLRLEACGPRLCLMVHCFQISSFYCSEGLVRYHDNERPLGRTFRVVWQQVLLVSSHVFGPLLGFVRSS